MLFDYFIGTEIYLRNFAEGKLGFEQCLSSGTREKKNVRPISNANDEISQVMNVEWSL